MADGNFLIDFVIIALFVSSFCLFIIGIGFSEISICVKYLLSGFTCLFYSSIILRE